MRVQRAAHLQARGDACGGGKIVCAPALLTQDMQAKAPTSPPHTLFRETCTLATNRPPLVRVMPRNPALPPRCLMAALPARAPACVPEGPSTASAAPSPPGCSLLSSPPPTAAAPALRTREGPACARTWPVAAPDLAAASSRSR